MVTRGKTADTQGFESTRSGTIYWTLSLYIEADKVAAALKLKPGERVEPPVFRRAQCKHLPSLALRNAIDPLMNDIADREMQGQLQEYLLAAIDEDDDDPGIANLIEAAARIRSHKTLTFRIPDSVSWMTEGVRFNASPTGMGGDREVQLRRFWLSHNNGALSYHLSFSHYYGGVDESGYNPSTYYFLSMLQKLAAPKEYAVDPELLDPERFKPEDAETEPFVDVFDGRTLDIDPLDKITVVEGEGKPDRFWPFVRTMFEADAENLFGKLAGEVDPDLVLDADFEKSLLDLVPFMEVPGLKVPKSRFMFMLHDERFFDRLMPLHPDTGETAPRKLMVQQRCYDAYQEEIRALREHGSERVSLDPKFWKWVLERGDYATRLDKGMFVSAVDPAEAATAPALTSLDDLVAAMRSGTCFEVRDLKRKVLPTPIRHHIPAFAARRKDCLDYLFLAGFNQNIIDFMNQDTSEILDSIDPIYPDSSDQSDERFFVRYANHRAMITYVPKSRSLEIGNDYIGTCPYAFLIHALALHNEFLARSHEARSLTRIKRIEAMIKGAPLPRDKAMETLQTAEPLDRGNRFDKAETAINQAKLAAFDQFERYRYENPFRYDTERDVFAKLEELRGISRKKEALSLAIDNLEDHASDLQLRHQKKVDQGTGRRELLLNLLLGGTGIFGAGQMFYSIGERAAEAKAVEPVQMAVRMLGSPSGTRIMVWTEVAMVVALLAFVGLILVCLVFLAVQGRRSMIAWMDEPDYDPPQEGRPKLLSRRGLKSLFHAAMAWRTEADDAQPPASLARTVLTPGEQTADSSRSSQMP